MQYGKKMRGGFAKGDMTPMIDMTFQLIAFFMVLVNFTEAVQDQRINLPSSELAKPPDEPLASMITLQLTKEGTVLLDGREEPVAVLQPWLTRQKQTMEDNGESASQSTIIIRADSGAKTGEVQELIEICQKTGFEKFALKAKQEQAQKQNEGT